MADFSLMQVCGTKPLVIYGLVITLPRSIRGRCGIIIAFSWKSEEICNGAMDNHQQQSYVTHTYSPLPPPRGAVSISPIANTVPPCVVRVIGESSPVYFMSLILFVGCRGCPSPLPELAIAAHAHCVVESHDEGHDPSIQPGQRFRF